MGLPKESQLILGYYNTKEILGMIYKHENNKGIL